MMKQYIEIKEQHPDAILLFRVGDFMRHSPMMQYLRRRYWVSRSREGQMVQHSLLSWQDFRTTRLIPICLNWYAPENVLQYVISWRTRN